MFENLKFFRKFFMNQIINFGLSICIYLIRSLNIIDYISISNIKKKIIKYNLIK